MPRSPAPRVSAYTLGLAATLTLGAALGGPVLALARGWFGHARVAPRPAFARPGGWTDAVRAPEALQADAIDALVAIALAVALLLLAGAAINLATLLLARASARRHETALRAVLGATPGELGRRALMRGALLGLAGGGAGVLLGAWGGALARGAWPDGADLFADAHPATGAAAAAGALTLLVLAAAALPAIAAARRNLYGALT
ncbi:FtsX-like permease family protein, partial [Longimicrobium sp.]|uniref:FtsX-like permease family protein n=1 Tax=Longimicrobium sp. TaxID=2029185 RepID=UPI002E37DB44